ncbi:VWA domain-containing protein [Yinghuangia aomiensis]
MLAVPALVLGGFLPSAATASAEGEEPPRMEMVLDLSGSMTTNDASGQTRLAAAKQAVGRIFDTAPEQIPLGLRVYGATYAGEDKQQGCADTQQLMPVGKMDAAARTTAKQRILAMNAVGFTPVGVALRAAADDLGTSGKRRIVLVSDGEDTCAPPEPCEVAKELKQKGVDLTVDTVGFKTDPKARAQLKCIADATNGTYTDANDADALTANLSTLFRRAWTTYQATGKPVQGSLNGCTDAPLVTPGQYLDKMTGGRDLYFKVKKRPDQLIQVSGTVVAEEGYAYGSILTVQAGTIGNGAPRDWFREFEQSVGWSNIITAGGRSKDDPGNKKTGPEDIGCIMLENDITKSGDKALPVELLVGIADVDPAKSAGKPEATPTPKTGLDATGGFSFNAATPIGAGTYKQSIAVGESPFWRVDLKPGQQLTVKAGVDIPNDFPMDTKTGWTLQVFNSTRNPVKCTKSHDSATKLFAGTAGRYEWVCDTWEIGDSGAESSTTDGYAVPGAYYFQVAVAEASDKAKGAIVPIDLTVNVGGTPRTGMAPVFVFDGDPASAPQGQNSTGGTNPNGTANGTDPSVAPTSAKRDEESTVGKIALPVGIVLAVALLGGVGYYGSAPSLTRHRGAAGREPCLAPAGSAPPAGPRRGWRVAAACLADLHGPGILLCYGQDAARGDPGRHLHAPRGSGRRAQRSAFAHSQLRRVSFACLRPCLTW